MITLTTNTTTPVGTAMIEKERNLETVTASFEFKNFKKIKF